MLKNLQDINANMCIKVYFWHSHQDKFPDNCGIVGDEHGEQFYQDVKTMEENHQRRCDKQMIADYCWSIKRDLNNIEHDRKSRKKKCLP